MPTRYNPIAFNNNFLHIKMEIRKSCLPLFPLFSKTLATNTKFWIIASGIECNKAVDGALIFLVPNLIKKVISSLAIIF